MKYLIAVSVVLLLVSARPVSAAGLPDVDGDRLLDAWEQVLGTNPNDSDSDQDGFNDWIEIVNNYDPLGPSKKTTAQDHDSDGLDDRLELLFGSDPTNSDTDGDGKKDGQEIAQGFSPTSTSPRPLPKTIEIKISTQKLKQKLGGVVLAEYPVSTGKKSTPTPPGVYKTQNKIARAWSSHAKLWMPWWMQFSSRGMGLHELPEWPGGRKEGVKSLGTPASGGCVRLGVGPAKKLYDWTPVGTPVIIVK